MTWSALNTIGPVAVVAIILRAEHRCAWCGVRPPPGRRHVDHVVPRSEGGSDEASNLVLSCAKCNSERRFDEIPDRAYQHGRTREDVVAEVRRQTAISIAPGSEVWRRAVALAPIWYPAQVDRRRRARAAWRDRQATEFPFGALAAE